MNLPFLLLGLVLIVFAAGALVAPDFSDPALLLLAGVGAACVLLGLCWPGGRRG